MAHITADRVRETSTTTGTGAFTLAGAVQGFRAFSAVLAVNDTCYYTIADLPGTNWEVGIGTYSAASTLTRTTILSSSNAGSAVSFTSGTKDVFITAAAGRFLQADSVGSYGNFSAGTVSITQQKYNNSYTQSFNQSYVPNAYLNVGEFQEICTVTPTGSSQNFQLVGEIYTQSGSSIQIIHFSIGLRSDALPALSWSGSYTQSNPSTVEMVKPVLWVKQTTTASFKLALVCLSSSLMNISVRMDVINRNSGYDNVVMNTTVTSDVSSVPVDYTQYDITRSYIDNNGSLINIGSATGTSFNSITGLSSSVPLVDGTATIGTSTLVARQDHIHPTDTSRAASVHTHLITDITDSTRWWNNFGDVHSTRTSFDATTPSYGYGWRYVQGSTNGPGTGGTQFYSMYTGLGNDYPATGAGSYGMYIAIDRNVTTPYLSVRYNESNALGTWKRIGAGNADVLTTARTITIGDTGKTFNGSANVSWSFAEIGATTTNTASKLVLRDASGNINAATVTASSLVISDPGVGNPAGFTFLKASDGAGIAVTEHTSDNTLYEFYMSDNPDGGDFFSWRFTDWQGINSLWQPLKIGALETTFLARNNYFNGNIVQNTAAFYTTRNSTGVSNNSLNVLYNTPSALKIAGTGTSTITAISVSGFTGTSGSSMWVKIAGTGTTFDWGYGSTASAATESGLTISTSPVTLSNGCTVTFSATTGFLVGDVFQCRVWRNSSNTIGPTAVTGALSSTTSVTGSTLVSTVSTGTAPLTVTSTTAVTNLNADLLDGNHASAFATAGQTMYIGTTAVTINRASAALALTGITSIDGNASTATRITSTDTRAVTTTPETLAAPGLLLDFKQNSSESLSDGGTYFGEMTFRPYGTSSDWTGGGSHQLGFTNNANVWHRYGTGTTWGSWVKLYDTVDASTTNTASKLVLRDSSGNINATNIVSSGGTINTTTYTSSEARIADGGIHLMKTVAGGVFEAVRAMNVDTTAGTTVRLLGAATSDPFNNANGGKVFIDAVRTSTNMDLVFSLNDVAGAAPVERVRISGNGNLVSSGVIGTTNTTSFGFSKMNNGGVVQTYKIATLPISNAGTYDHVVITGVLDDNWGSTNKTKFDVLFSNRNGFTYRFYQYGDQKTNAKVLAYTETDTSISVWVSLAATTYSTISANVEAGINCTIYQGGLAGTPTGTLSFDSGANATYPPILNIGYTTPKYKENTIWHAGNDGASSGLDADLLDGLHASSTNTASTVVARDASGNFSAGTITATLSGSATSVVATVTGTNSTELVRGNMGDNDQARILVGATATNAGYLEIATADDGNEPIHVRQYTGVFGTLTRTATILDASGNTVFPGTVQGTQLISTVATGTAPLTVSSTTAVTNLNADLLDGNHASAFYLATNPSGYTTNTGTVTSVGLSLPSIFTVTNSPVTTSGTLTGTLASQTANQFFAAPNGSAGAPAFRAIVAADIPTLNQNTTGSAATLTTARTINGVSFNGSADISVPRIPSKGNSSAETLRAVNDTGIYTFNVANASLGDTTPTSYWSVLAWGNGTGGSAELAAEWTSNGNNLYFRSLRDVTDNWWVWKKIWNEGNDGAGSGLDADLLDGNHASAFYLATNPSGYTTNVGTVTSVGLSLPSIFTVTNSPVTTSGTLTGTLASQTANTVFAAPNGAAGAPTFRSLVAADVPTLNQDTTGSAARLTNLTSTTTTTAGADNTESCVSYINAISLFGQTDGALYSHVYSASWKHNIYGDYRTGQLAIRGKNNGTWQAWRTVWDSSNLTNLNQLTNGPGYTTNVGTVTSVGGTGTVSGLTLSGTVTTSGNLTLGGTLSADAAAISSGTIATGRLGSGTANSTTYLRGDQTWATIVSGASLSNDTTTNATYYPLWATATTGTPTTIYTSSTKYYFNPSTGTLSSTTFNSLSDENYKENIEQIVDPIGIVKQLTGVTFDWKDTAGSSYGFIAQEVEKILPHAVATDEGKKTLNYSSVIPFLVESIKEQQKIIDIQEERIKRLEEIVQKLAN